MDEDKNEDISNSRTKNIFNYLRKKKIQPLNVFQIDINFTLSILAKKYKKLINETPSTGHANIMYSYEYLKRVYGSKDLYKIDFSENKKSDPLSDITNACKCLGIYFTDISISKLDDHLKNKINNDPKIFSISDIDNKLLTSYKCLYIYIVNKQKELKKNEECISDKYDRVKDNYDNLNMRNVNLSYTPLNITQYDNQTEVPTNKFKDTYLRAFNNIGASHSVGAPVSAHGHIFDCFIKLPRECVESVQKSYSDRNESNADNKSLNEYKSNRSSIAITKKDILPSDIGRLITTIKSSVTV